MHKSEQLSDLKAQKKSGFANGAGFVQVVGGGNNQGTLASKSMTLRFSQRPHDSTSASSCCSAFPAPASPTLPATKNFHFDPCSPWNLSFWPRGLLFRPCSHACCFNHCHSHRQKPRALHSGPPRVEPCILTPSIFHCDPLR